MNSLKNVLKIAKNKEDDEAKKLSEVKGQLTAEQTKLGYLQHYYQDYKLKLKQNAHEGVNASQFRHYVQFIQHLEKLIEIQEVEIKKLEHQYENQRDNWHQAHLYVDNIEKLIEKRHHELFQKEEKKEQKELDELTLRKLNTEQLRQPSGKNT